MKKQLASESKPEEKSGKSIAFSTANESITYRILNHYDVGLKMREDTSELKEGNSNLKPPFEWGNATEAMKTTDAMQWLKHRLLGSSQEASMFDMVTVTNDTLPKLEGTFGQATGNSDLAVGRKQFLEKNGRDWLYVYALVELKHGTKSLKENQNVLELLALSHRRLTSFLYRRMLLSTVNFVLARRHNNLNINNKLSLSEDVRPKPKASTIPASVKPQSSGGRRANKKKKCCLLATNCNKEWELFEFDGNKKILRTIYTSSRKCLDDFLALLFKLENSVPTDQSVHIFGPSAPGDQVLTQSVRQSQPDLPSINEGQDIGVMQTFGGEQDLDGFDDIENAKT